MICVKIAFQVNPILPFSSIHPNPNLTPKAIRDLPMALLSFFTLPPL
jgi:hypothetical protein